MVAHQADGFNIPHGDDTHYISRKDQGEALCLENDGLCRPLRISTSKRTSIYLVVWHGQHEAPAHLVLSPFTLPQYPHQTFYGAYLWYTRCCDEGPNQDAITTTLRRVYDIFFPLGKCHFDKHNQQEVHVGAFTELSCHERAQCGLDRLQQGPDSALKRPLNGSLYESHHSASEAPIERLPKRRRQDNSEQGSLTPIDSRQENPRPDSPRQENPRQENPRQENSRQENPRQENSRQENPRQDSPRQDDLEKVTQENNAKAIMKKATDGLKQLCVKDKATQVSRYIDFVVELPVQLINGCVQVKEHQSELQTQNSTTIWQLGGDHHAEAKVTTWFLFLVSSCLKMVETNLGMSAPYLGTKEEKRRSRWVKGISVLNRIIDQMGFMGFRLYDAYAKNCFYFSPYAEKAEDHRNSIADLAAKLILREGIQAPADSRVLYIPNLITSIFNANNKKSISQEDVCKVLGLESFAKFRIDSAFVPLRELHAEHMRLQSSRARRNIESLSHDDGREDFLVRDSPNAAQPTPARSPTAASDTQRVETSSSSRSGSESTESPDYATPNEASRSFRQPQTEHPATEPGGEVNIARKDSGLSCAQQLSTQECLPNQPLSQGVVPLNPASANPTMAALNNQVERVAHQTPPAFNVRGQETVVPVNSGSPLEQDFPPNRPHSPPPSHRPAEVAHQCQPGYAPPPPPTIQIRPNSPTIQSHGTEFPLNCRSGSRGELPIQTPPASRQPSQQSEADTTHQPAVRAPATKEQANTASKDTDLDSSMQDPPPVKPYGYEPSHSAAETPCYAQQGNVPPHPPAIRTSPDTAPMQSHVARARSLESRPELHQVITREGSGNPRTSQSSEAYLSPSMPHPASARQDCPSPRTTPRVPVESRVTEPRTDVPVDASQAPEFGQGSSEPQDFEHMDPWPMIDNMIFDDEDPDFWRGWITT
ncbi:hypothetical protein MRS44_013988 [Fusarium solani]|uniref:uncharacterized protein n=1 Tax=Fusarium solani TaxID=169388 RepID=UPI0032C3DCC3|nr:hypothetical protein MRS44_013975 [Fusarium solani]KAJ3455388.1 hypothetical protein MRS44_013988 [Fusarium solani]